MARKTIYYNGTIVTVCEKNPIAQAVLVENGKIVAVGSNEEILKYKDDQTDLVYLQGKTMLPGFIDSHSHILSSRLYVRFSTPPIGNISSINALITAAKEEITKNPAKKHQWFIGMGYDNAAFSDGLHPTRKDLDKISSDIPIVIMHVSGHVGVLNSKALELIGITAETPTPEGGVIHHFEDGTPTGLLEEAAIIQTLRSAGDKMMPSFRKKVDAAIEAQKYYASFGITTAQDGATESESLRLLKYLRFRKKLLLDICAYPMVDKCQRDLQGIDSRSTGYKNHLKIAGAKLLLDGSPQAKTAWLTQPYYVVPKGEEDNYKGYPVYQDDVVCDYFKDCLKNNWQILVHCNGDAASDQFIAQYARAMKETGITTNLRPVMVHCQTIREDQLDRMKQLGILPTFFHDHTYYWGDYHLSSVLGPERGRRISPLQSAVKRRMSFTLHQDTPVAPPNMLLAIHNAVNRITYSGQPIGTEYAVSVEEAIKAVTIYAAYQYFEENNKGSIEPGKLADFVILDKNPLQVPKEEIKEIKVLATIKEDVGIYAI